MSPEEQATLDLVTAKLTGAPTFFPNRIPVRAGISLQLEIHAKDGSRRRTHSIYVTQDGAIKGLNLYPDGTLELVYEDVA